MKFLGVDYGNKKIGLAISDDKNILAFPKAVILNNKNLFENLIKIIKSENIDEIVVGESVFLREHNIIEKEIKIFILKLRGKIEKEIKKTLPIHQEKEFFTSLEARRLAKNKISKSKTSKNKISKNNEKKVDALAAALILQRYLEKLNYNKSF